MTATAHRTADAGRLAVYDTAGRIVATVGQARSEWFGWLLAECDEHHVYLIGDAIAGCPICDSPRGDEELSDAD